MSARLDELRARAHAAIGKLPGALGDVARKANDALGRPLADVEELADRRAFAERTARREAGASGGAAASDRREAAPVIIYHMDKTRRDAETVADMLAAENVPYKVSNIQEDPAAQMAVRRDSKGFRLPVVFIAGEPIGGRAELSNLIASGELVKKVFGS